MDIEKVVAALNSDLRREILKIIAGQTMTVVEVLKELNKRGLEVRYRESVYRALEKLLEAGLVQKYYVKEKGLCYKITLNRVVIDITKGTIEEANRFE